MFPVATDTWSARSYINILVKTENENDDEASTFEITWCTWDTHCKYVKSFGYYSATPCHALIWVPRILCRSKFNFLTYHSNSSGLTTHVQTPRGIHENGGERTRDSSFTSKCPDWTRASTQSVRPRRHAACKTLMPRCKKNTMSCTEEHIVLVSKNLKWPTGERSCARCITESANEEEAAPQILSWKSGSRRLDWVHSHCVNLYYVYS